MLTAAGFPTLRSYGFYGVAMGPFLLLFEWPRSRRQRGTSVERWCGRARGQRGARPPRSLTAAAPLGRRGQHYLAYAVHLLGPLGRNYFVRFILHLGCACLRPPVRRPARGRGRCGPD